MSDCASVVGIDLGHKQAQNLSRKKGFTNPKIIKGKLSTYRHSPIISPTKLSIKIASRVSGNDPEDVIAVPTMKSANVLHKLTRTVQRASHPIKRRGRYFQWHSFPAAAVAKSIVIVRKAKKARKRNTSFENFVV